MEPETFSGSGSNPMASATSHQQYLNDYLQEHSASLLGTLQSYVLRMGLAAGPMMREIVQEVFQESVVEALVINAQTGQPIHFFDLVGQSMAVTSWSPDGKYLAALVNSNSIWVWNATFQVVMQQSLDGAYPGYSMPGMFAWQPGTDNMLFARGNLFQGVWVGLEAPHAVLWNVPQNKLLKQYDIKNTGFFSWSANGRYLPQASIAS